MEKSYLWITFIIVGVAMGAWGQVSQLEAHLEQLTGVRNPLAGDDEPRLAARQYIKDMFREMGLEVQQQTFNTQIPDYNDQRLVEGENIVGVVRGSEGGGVVVLGADYDTPRQGAPLENNGAGVAVMLEAARLFSQQTTSDFSLKYTVVFVAFDLNTKEYGSDVYGQSGSYHFLHQWLWPFLNQSADNFAGAIILDSISKFNTQPNSQYLLPDFADAFPQAHQRITSTANKGDFLAMFVRDDQHSLRLAQTFNDNFLKDRRASQVRLQDLPVRTGVSGVLEMFNHQSHFPFWTFRPSEDQVPLPAILLTDTDVYRLDGEACPTSCTPDAFLTRSRRLILTKITDLLTSTLLMLQTERIPEEVTAGGRGACASLAVTGVVLVLARIFV